MYQVSFFFVLKVEINFRELIRKNSGRVCVKGFFGMACFMEKIWLWSGVSRLSIRQSAEAAWRGSLGGPAFVSRSQWGTSLLLGARFIAWSLRNPFFRGLSTEPEAFWGMSGVSGLQQALRPDPLLKKPCATVIRSLARATNIFGSKSCCQRKQHTSASCGTTAWIWSGVSRLSKWQSAEAAGTDARKAYHQRYAAETDLFLKLQGSVFPVFNPCRRFIAWCLGTSFQENTDGA